MPDQPPSYPPPGAPLSPPPSGALRLLARITELSLQHPFKFVAGALLLLAASVGLAKGLDVRSSFEELLPANVPSVAQVKELVRRVGGDGTVLVTIERLEGSKDLKAAEALANELGPEFLAMGPDTIRSVQWNVQTIERYYQAHWPMFLSQEELQQALKEIDAGVKQAKRAANPLRLHLDDAPEKPATIDSPWLDLKRPMPEEQVAQRFARYTDGYFVHPDGKSVTVVVRPAGTSLGVAEARKLLDAMTRIVQGHQQELEVAHLRVGMGGTFPMFVAEYEAILHDVFSTATICVLLVFGSLLLFFRDLRSTLSLGFAVVVAVAATFGVTRLVIGYLNTQTAFLGSIVVGNGINYGLIYLARVRQLRRAGVGLAAACHRAAPDTARATLLAALGSSVSFATLILAANRGFRHFGFIGGIGMVLCWLFTFLLIPALLALSEKVFPLQPLAHAAPTSPPVPAWLEACFRHPGRIVAAFGVLAVASAVLFLRTVPGVIEHNLGNLTNDLKGQAQLVRDNQRANDALGQSLAGAVALMPSWDDADAFCKVIRERKAAQPRYEAVLEGCDTLSSVVPRDQVLKLDLVNQIIARLTDARIERLTPAQATRVRRVREELQAQRRIDVSEAPAVLMDRFREKDGSLGKLAVSTAKPDAKLELGPNLQAFVEAVRHVPVNGRLYDATGENIVFADLLKDIEREGPLTTLGSFLGVFVLVVLFFRFSAAAAGLMASLTVGIILMAGAATVLGIKINFFNFIVFPITFGIAVDYGANILVRTHERGRLVLTALREVGPAVALCSWTSMIGYGSLLLALNRALRSFGWYAIVGEVTSILAALVLLPALVMLWQRKVR